MRANGLGLREGVNQNRGGSLFKSMDGERKELILCAGGACKDSESMWGLRQFGFVASQPQISKQETFLELPPFFSLSPPTQAPLPCASAAPSLSWVAGGRNPRTICPGPRMQSAPLRIALEDKVVHTRDLHHNDRKRV